MTISIHAKKSVHKSQHLFIIGTLRIETMNRGGLPQLNEELLQKSYRSIEWEDEPQTGEKKYLEKAYLIKDG